MQDRLVLLQALSRALERTWEGEFFIAEQLFKQMELKRPEFPEGLFAYGCFKLLQGEYDRGWPLFQHRIDTQAYIEKKTTQIQKPYWDGVPSKTATLLIHRDQGYGDVFMSARYFNLAAQRMGRTLLSVPRGAGLLFRSAFPEIEVIEDGEKIPLSEVDFHLHSLSLPSVFKTTIETIPSSNVFTALPNLKLKWQNRIKGDFKVGVCWQGNPMQERDPERSIPLKSMLPVLSVKNVQFYGLQVGIGEEQISDVNNNLLFEHIGPKLNNKDLFVDVIAAMSCLDLVVTVDTGIAHLAGSMGIPVWILVGKVPYWPYLLEGNATPWYPTARLFRTKKRYAWDGAIDEVVEELKKLTNSA